MIMWTDAANFEKFWRFAEDFIWDSKSNEGHMDFFSKFDRHFVASDVVKVSSDTVWPKTDNHVYWTCFSKCPRLFEKFGFI